jgi:hypothetical protein
LNFRQIPLLLVTAACALFAPAAFAVVLAPGSGGVPTDFTSCGGACAGFAGGFTGVAVPLGGFLTGGGTSAPAGTFSGTFNVAYGVDAVTTHLDFLYQLDVAASDLKSVSLSFYNAGLGSVDVGYLTDTASISGAAFDAPSSGICGAGSAPCTPTSADWFSPPVVGYSFVDAGAGVNHSVMAAQNSPILIVRTMVDTHGFGVAGWQDSVNFQTTAFDPTPEPAYAGLLLGGLFGLGLLVRRFQARQN